MNEKLLEIMNEVLEDAEKESLKDLQPELNLYNDLEMDSLMLAQLTVLIEAEFDIDVFEDNVVSTVSEILEKLER